MNRKILKIGGISLMLLLSLAPATAYHIDAAWVPVNAATDINTNCPTTHMTLGEPGTDCNNDAARGWVAGTPGLVACEQNHIEGPGTPGTNGMCFASNQDSDTGDEICGAGGQFDPTRGSTYNGGSNTSDDAEPGGQTPNTSHIMYFDNVANWAHHQCLDKHDWTKLWIYSYDPIVCRDMPQTGACRAAAGNVYAQVRVGTNANGMLLTPSDVITPAASDCIVAYPPSDMVGGIDGAGNEGRCDPRGEGPFLTFYYRELLAYWIDGGHVTFFVNFAASGNPQAGSYWAESLAAGDTPADDNELMLGVECNHLYDDRIKNPSGPGTGNTTKVYRGATGPDGGPYVETYFNIFEPVTYVVMSDMNVDNALSVSTFLDDAATTVCRGA